MRIAIVTPAPPGSRYGNRVTALRWARILRRLGNSVSISQIYAGQPFDLLVALHARRSHPSIISFQRHNPIAPIVVALTGTDLYRDIRISHLVRESLEVATRIVVLQPKAIELLQPGLRAKARVIYQSVEDNRALRAMRSGSTKPATRSSRSFDVCVIGYLRVVKDPFRTAMAARLLPSSSRIRILQVGGAMTDAMAAKALREMRVNQRYEWLGERKRAFVSRVLATSKVCVISSRMEGGANVLSEAITASVPILASRIDGNSGILGRDYPGYFAVGDTRELARLLTRVETSAEYRAELRQRVKSLAPLFTPSREQKAWSALMEELS